MKSQTRNTKGFIRKTGIALAIVAATATSSTAFAGSKARHSGDAYFDYARVLKVRPITKSIKVSEPIESCWDKPVTYQRSSSRRNHSRTPDVIGAIVGAAVGNRIGKHGHGRARDVATVAGAVLGGSIGRDIRKKGDRHHHETYTETVRHCETRHDVRYEDRVVGYRVKYRYNGTVYKTRMDRHPGDEIKVRVNVTPVIH